VLSRIGYFVETAAAYPNLTVWENLRIQQRLTGCPAAAVDDVIDLLRLGEYRHRRAGKLSLGNRQRLSLARALVHKPQLLILDEPANGLDPAGIVEIRALLRRLADEQGVTIFMSSHLLDEVEHLADRVGIVHNGTLVEEVDSRELQENGRLVVEIDVDDVAGAERVLREKLGLVDLQRSGAATLRVSDRNAEAAPIARALVGAGISLRRLAPLGEDLERHFMRLTGGRP
jgi:ABC-type multidrug transport system ATPase subunit